MAVDWAQTISTLTPTLGLGGGAFVWIWNRIEARIAELKRDHAAAVQKIEAEAERCEARERRSVERHGILVTVIELLWRAVERHDPAAPELKRGEILMDRYKALGAEAERTVP
jgi:transposase